MNKQNNLVTILLQDSTVIKGSSMSGINKDYLIKAKKDGILCINKADFNPHAVQGQIKSSICYINFDNILSITID